jgi:hypothetical protein
VLQPTDILWLLIILALLLNIAMLVMSILIVIRVVWKAHMTELWLLVIWESSLLLMLGANVIESIFNHTLPCSGNIGCLMVLIMQIVFTGTELLMMFVVTVHMIRLISRDGLNTRNRTIVRTDNAV